VFGGREKGAEALATWSAAVQEKEEQEGGEEDRMPKYR